LAVILTAKVGNLRPYLGAVPMHKVAICWFVSSAAAILYLAFSKHQMSGFLMDFCTSLLPLLGVAALIRILTNRSTKYENLPSQVAGVGALILGMTSVSGMLSLTISSLPNVYDPVLYRFEHILGISFEVPFYHLFSARIIGPSTYQAIYNYIGLAIILAARSEFVYSPNRLQAGLVLRFLVVAAIGYGLYYLMPVLDPAGFFGPLFPYRLPEVQSVATHVVKAPLGEWANVARNTMPSLHAAWAILGFLALRHSPVWHKILGVLLILAILIVTLGAGQHYAVDWIAALPLVLLARGISAVSLPIRHKARQIAIFAGAALLVLWVLAVRVTPESLKYPVLIQLLGLASVVLPLWLELRLARAEDRTARHDDEILAVSAEMPEPAT